VPPIVLCKGSTFENWTLKAAQIVDWDKRISLDTRCLAAFNTAPARALADPIIAKVQEINAEDIVAFIDDATKAVTEPVTYLGLSGVQCVLRAVLHDDKVAKRIGSVILAGGVFNSQYGDIPIAVPLKTDATTSNSETGFYCAPHSANDVLRLLSNNNAHPALLVTRDLSGVLNVPGKIIRAYGTVTSEASKPWPTPVADIFGTVWAFRAHLEDVHFGGHPQDASKMVATLVYLDAVPFDKGVEPFFVNADTGMLELAAKGAADGAILVPLVKNVAQSAFEEALKDLAKSHA
jgi:hypothetical protein